MFKKETVFILGAGASNPYGYPLGKELINTIINNINNDMIYLPKIPDPTGKYFWNDNNGKESNGKIEMPYLLTDFLTTFEQIAPESLKNTTKLPYNQNGIVINGSWYIKVHLNQIEEFFNLKKALIDFDPISIDTFLRDNKAHGLAGKIMIIYSLLKCKSKLYPSKYIVKNDQHEHTDYWYGHLLNDALSGCEKPEDVLKNKLSIVTFNYDVSIDFYLYDKISKTESLKENNVALKFIEMLKNKRIIHIYGQLCKDELIPKIYSELYTEDKDKENTIIEVNSKRFVMALQNRSNIKLINDERKDLTAIDEIHDIINTAKEIIIIGFSFDRDNLTTLGFPNKLKEYGKFLAGKELKYMDYKGNMNSLYNQFNEIQKLNQNILITRSPAEYIINAYQNDFKIYLYQ